MARFAQFRILHLLLLVLLLASALWLTTQAGMATAKVELLDVSALSFEGPAGSHDNFGPYQAKLRFRFVQPESLANTVVNVFLNTTESVVRRRAEASANNKTLVFRFRQESVLWMRPDNPVEKAVQLLGIQADEIEETITEVNPVDFIPK